MGENELPDSWIWAKLESITKRIGDVDHKMPSAVTSGIPYISTKNFHGEDGIDFSAAKHISREDYLALSRKIKPEAGDILLSRYGTVGEIRKVSSEIEFQASYSIAIIKMFSVPYLTDFLAYALKSDVVQKQIKRDIRATAQPDLGLEYIRQFQIPLAPLAEQQRIVAAIEQQFTRLDAGVAALKSAQKRLKRYRAAVLKAAVEGKLTEAWRAEHPTSEPASLLLERILVERRAKWEADLRAKGKDPAKVKYVEPATPEVSGLMELPENWCWATVEQLLIEPLCNGISIKGSDTPPGVPSLRLSSMSEYGFDYSDRRYILISEKDAESLAIKEDDYFVSRGNGSLHLIGRGTLAQTPPERIVFPDTMIRHRFIKVGILSRFIAYIWPSIFMRSQIEAKARTTAGIYKISQSDVEAFILPLPPLKEQQQIVTEVERRLSIVSQLEATVEANLKRAERMRQSILKEAFAGRLVPQDPNDEPASVLLERIRQEREALSEHKQGKEQSRQGNGKKTREKSNPTREYVMDMVEQEPEPIDSSELEQVALWHGVAD